MTPEQLIELLRQLLEHERTAHQQLRAQYHELVLRLTPAAPLPMPAAGPDTHPVQPTPRRPTVVPPTPEEQVSKVLNDKVIDELAKHLHERDGMPMERAREHAAQLAANAEAMWS